MWPFTSKLYGSKTDYRLDIGWGLYGSSSTPTATSKPDRPPATHTQRKHCAIYRVASHQVRVLSNEVSVTLELNPAYQDDRNNGDTGILRDGNRDQSRANQSKHIATKLMKLQYHKQPPQVLLAILSLISIISSCTIATPRIYHGVTPISPAMKSDPYMQPMNPIGFMRERARANEDKSARYPVVDSLQPTLQWKPITKKEILYDVGIWEAPVKRVDVKVAYLTTSFSWGTPVYLAEKLSTTSHRVAVPLKPNTAYFWSVRTRQGNDFSKWSSYHQRFMEEAGIASVFRSEINQPFNFKTPPQ